MGSEMCIRDSLPVEEIGAVRIVAVGMVLLILIPHPPQLRGNPGHAGVDDAVGGEGKRALILPVPEIAARVVHDAAGTVLFTLLCGVASEK